MFIEVALISGFMVGIEFQWQEPLMVLDLGIIRIIIGKEEEWDV